MVRPLQNACAHHRRCGGQLPNVSFGKVDVDNAIELAKRYKIVSIPNVCVFKDGELVDRIIGLCDEDELTETISKHI